MSHEVDCCICLKSDKELRERLGYYNGYYCCKSCVARAVKFAYEAACAFGGFVGGTRGGR